MDEEIEREESEVCHFCGKVGGEYHVDPYAQEINDHTVERRFHDDCLIEQGWEI